MNKRIFHRTPNFIAAIMLLTGLIAAHPAVAQHGWTYNASDYANSGEVVASVTFDGTRVSSGTLGAFVGEECRGYTDALLFPGNGEYVFQLLIHSNASSGETISFRYYNPDDGQIYDVNETIEFVSDMIEGNADIPLPYTVTVNEAPVVDAPVADQSQDEYFGSTTIDLSTVFSDPDSDPLTYTAQSSNTSVATVSVSGSTLTISEQGLGTTTITATADDGEFTTDDEFTFTINNVNENPVVDNPIPDQTYNEYFGSDNIDLSNVFSDPDAGDVLTLSAASSDNSVVTVSVSGTTLTLTEQGLGAATVTVTATDDGDGNLTVSDDFTVTINNVNETPVVDNPIPDQTYDEYFGSDPIDLTGVFSDPDAGDVLTLSATSSDNSVATVSVTGTTLTLNEQGLGTATITVTATDDGDGNLTASDDFTVTINNVNEAPVVDNPIPDQSLDEYFGTWIIDLTNVFSDPDAGDVLTLSAASSDNSVVTVSVSGTTLTLTEQGLGNATVTVTATDDGEGTLSTTDLFDVVVTNVNDTPVVVNPIPDQVYDEYFDSNTLNISDVFDDIDGDDLTYTVSSSNTGVIVPSVSGTILTLTEAGLGTALITLTASDGELSVSDQFSVEVVNVNDAPVLNNPVSDRTYQEYFSTATISLASRFNDPDGDVITLTATSSDPTVVGAAVTGTTLTLTEQGLGSATVTVTAFDGELSTDDPFQVTVNNVNDPPVVDNPIPDQSYLEYFGSDAIDLSQVFSDKDNDPLTLTAVSSNTGIVMVSVSGTTLTVTETGLGTCTVTVTASDGTLSADEPFQVVVNNVNDAPEVDNPVPDQTYDEHFGSATIDLSGVFSDPDGEVVNLSAVSSDPEVVNVSLSGTSLTITETGLGTSTITLTGSDGTLSTTDDFQVTVNNVNDAPELVSPISSISRNEGFGSETIDLEPVFDDPDDDPLSYSVSNSNTSVVTVSLSGTILTITEVGLGNASITVTASDGTLSTDDQFNVAVNNVNDQPEVLNPIGDRSYDEGFSTNSINLSPRFSDPDGDVLTFSATSSNTSVVNVSVSGSVLTITEAGLGNAMITVTASDGSLSVDDNFTVSVNNVNDPPVLDNPLPDLNLDEYFDTQIVDLAGTFDDPDGDDLTLSAVSSNAGVVSAGLSGTTLTLTETGLGTSIITVTASDGQYAETDQFRVTVSNVNDAPVVVSPVSDRTYFEGFGSAGISLAPVFNDPDGDVLSLSAASSDEGIVTVSLSGTTLTIAETGLGTATVTLTATDGDLSVTDQFTVTVNNVNDQPVVENPLADRELDEHFGTETIDLTPVFSDPDLNDILTYEATSSDDGVVSVSISGALLTLHEEGLGTVTITITATDDGEGNLSVSESFELTVNNVNDPPVLESPVSDLVLDEYFDTEEVDVTGAFSDPDEDALTLSVVSSNTGVVSVSLADNTITLTEEGLGVATVTLTATDGMLSTDHTFSVTVNNVNDTPVVDNPVGDQVYDEHFGSDVIDLTNVFSDPDEDALTISAGSADTQVVGVSLNGMELTISEAGNGSTTITLTASDGSLEVSQQFAVTVNNVNDPPVLDQAVGDTAILHTEGPLEYDLAGIFSDPDEETLSYSFAFSDPDVLDYTLEGSLLTLTVADTGITEVVLIAEDTEFSARDTFRVTVIEEIPLRVYYEDELVEPGDTLVRCNNADEFYLDVKTTLVWEGHSATADWYLMEPDNDSMLIVAYSENLTGGDRVGELIVTDEQDHELIFYFVQTADCNPDGIPGFRTLDLAIYPNPVDERLFISVADPEVREVEIAIFDQQGRMLYRKLQMVPAGGLLTLPMEAYRPGSYPIRVTSGAGRFTGLIIKQP